MWSAINQAACWVWTDSTDSWSTWISLWVSLTSRAADGEQISWTLPRWSQLSCQHVCDWSSTHCLWLRMLPVNQMENQHHFRGLNLFFFFSFFFGGPLSGWTGGEGKMKRKREGEFIPLTLQSELFLAALWGKTWWKSIPGTQLRLNVWLPWWVYFMCGYVCNFVVVCVWIC